MTTANAELKKIAATEKDPEVQKYLNNIIRTSAVLAVLAALAAGQQAAHTSGTILAQAEATNKWNYYQSKSIKRYLRLGEIDLVQVMVHAEPTLKPVLAALEEQQRSESNRYEQELAGIKAEAEELDRVKRRHQRQNSRFQLAFAALQAGVVLSTIAASAGKKKLWIGAVLVGLIGLFLAVDGHFLLV